MAREVQGFLLGGRSVLSQRNSSRPLGRKISGHTQGGDRS